MIKSFCCVSRGTPRIEANFEKNVFVIGEKARVLYRLDASNYKDNIEKVTLTVIRSLSLRNGKGRERHFHRTLISQKEMGVAAGVKVEDGQLIELQIGQKDFTLETLQDLPFQPSMKSPLVDISYTLRLIAHPVSMCMNYQRLPFTETKVKIIPPIELPPSMPMMIMQAPPMLMLDEETAAQMMQAQPAMM